MACKVRNSIQEYLKTTELFNNKYNLQNSGVYQLICNDCGTTYTGQTGRSFKKKDSKKLSLI
jgi:transposase-like protein